MWEKWHLPGATLVSIVNSSDLYVNAYAPLDIVDQT